MAERALGAGVGDAALVTPGDSDGRLSSELEQLRCLGNNAMDTDFLENFSVRASQCACLRFHTAAVLYSLCLASRCTGYGALVAAS